MIITETQRHSLADLIQIAFARAAASLSALVGSQLHAGATQLQICAFRDAVAGLGAPGAPAQLAITQRFGGTLDGAGLLALDQQSAVQLVALLTGERLTARLDESGREVLLEVGTTLIGACIRALGSVGGARVTFAVPQLTQLAPEPLARSLVAGGAELRLGMLLSTTLLVRSRPIHARMLVVVSMSTLDQIARGVAPAAVRLS
jgi:chemotaxis protein CheY-P-specific phosphatase CheC